MLVKNDATVYVKETDAREDNWYGELKSYYPSSNFCEVETNSGNIERVLIEQVFSAQNPNKNIREFLV